jgi:hypothetical protein
MLRSAAPAHLNPRPLPQLNLHSTRVHRNHARPRPNDFTGRAQNSSSPFTPQRERASGKVLTLTRQVGSRPRQATKPCQQRSQMGAVFVSDRGEFQPHSASALHMAHNSLGSDLPFFDEKINLCLGPNRLRFMCLNKNSPEAQIPNARNITTPRATPIHPNPLRRSDARSLSPGVGRHLK